jgi:hypothetical protein
MGVARSAIGFASCFLVGEDDEDFDILRALDLTSDAHRPASGVSVLASDGEPCASARGHCRAAKYVQGAAYKFPCRGRAFFKGARMRPLLVVWRGEVYSLLFATYAEGTSLLSNSYAFSTIFAR